MRFFKTVSTILTWAVLAAVLAAAGFVLVASRQGWQFDAVLSGSMEPVYHVGGLVVMRPVDPQSVRVGDIIAFNLPNTKTPVCHRVIEIGSDGGSTYFVTKGDANEEPDLDRVLTEYVKGRGVLHIPYVGRLAEVANVGRTRVSILGLRLPAAVIAVAAFGILFIGLTLRDTLTEVLWPAKRWRKDVLKRRSALNLRRRRAFKIG